MREGLAISRPDLLCSGLAQVSPVLNPQTLVVLVRGRDLGKSSFAAEKSTNTSSTFVTLAGQRKYMYIYIYIYFLLLVSK